MCTLLNEHALIKSIQEDLGETHALPTHPEFGCILLECVPPRKYRCRTTLWRCHNDACGAAIQRFDAPLGYSALSYAVYCNHDFVFNAKLSIPPASLYVGCAICVGSFIDDDKDSPALRKSKLL